MSCIQISLKECAIVSALAYKQGAYDHFIEFAQELYNTNVESVNFRYSYDDGLQREPMTLEEVENELSYSFFHSLLIEVEKANYFQKHQWLSYYEYQSCEAPNYKDSKTKELVDYAHIVIKNECKEFDKSEWGFNSMQALIN